MKAAVVMGISEARKYKIGGHGSSTEKLLECYHLTQRLLGEDRIVMERLRATLSHLPTSTHPRSGVCALYKNHTSPAAHPAYSPVSERPKRLSQKKMGPFNSKTSAPLAYCVSLGAKIWLHRKVAELTFVAEGPTSSHMEMTTAIMGKLVEII